MEKTWAEMKYEELIEKRKENWDEDDWNAYCYIEECKAEDQADMEYLGCFSVWE